MTTVAIIQARMGSARLPGKVLRDLCGRPLLWHIVERLNHCHNIDDVVIATSAVKRDDAIENFAATHNVKIFRGSEENVLERTILAAQKYKADYVVRVTGDSPLISITEIDRLIHAVVSKKADFFTRKTDAPCLLEGFEVVSLSALQQVMQSAKLKRHHKEHVTVYLKEYIDEFKSAPYEPLPLFLKEGYRLSVDTMPDFQFMEFIYKKFWDQKNPVNLKKVIPFLENNPKIKAMNSGVTQKKWVAQSKKVLFLIHGGKTLGLGHLRRSLEVAKSLTEKYACGVTFVVNDHMLKKCVAENGFGVEFVKTEILSADASPRIKRILRKYQIDHVVIDVKSDHNPAFLMDAIQRDFPSIKIALIDNGTEAVENADVCIFPTYPTIEFFPVRREFWPLRRSKKRGPICISMGGADPNGLTLKVMNALAKTSGEKVVVVAGALNNYLREIKALAKTLGSRFEVLASPDDFPQVLMSSSLLITALGITVYEAAYCKTPVVVIANYEADDAPAKSLEKAGYCSYLGVYKKVTHRMIAAAVKKGGAAVPQKCPDKKGAQRVARAILRSRV